LPDFVSLVWEVHNPSVDTEASAFGSSLAVDGKPNYKNYAMRKMLNLTGCGLRGQYSQSRGALIIHDSTLSVASDAFDALTKINM
jgi:hypothetical protein